MVEIISRRDGPRPEDVRLKSFLQDNRATITGIADRLTQGGYSAAKAAPALASEPARKILHVVGTPTAPVREARPVVRVTINGRVVVVDDNSGRQLHHLGNVRRSDGRLFFTLASAANRFPAPIAAELAEALDDLDAAELAPDGGEAALAQEIAQRLGFEAQ